MKNRTYAEAAAEGLGDELYMTSYGASLAVLKNVVPFVRGGDDTAARLLRSVKAIPRLIAAGLHASVPELRRRFTLGEAMIRCRETVVMLSYCRDLDGRFVNGALCSELIQTYRAVSEALSKIAATRGTAGEAVA